ncbi:1-phosphatidylinositol phosphodiesterase-like [Scomber scombrus]|uniref:1-phosphatidylinositol phosphodiesterase-like n=1 Tax=Scomber scombrus TaxID=13677 RepID=UPI002DDC78B0|nr:1-phosphatidylinositol phosphodiesterase-like [Scomber scombrus]
MKSIPDETPISAISIPGTHKSLSLYGGDQCQVWTLNQQLKVGLRYFDVHAGFNLPTDKDVIIRDESPQSEPDSLELGAGSGFNDLSALDVKFHNLDWMKSIPDETPISAISIPGTHKSLSLYGGVLIQCQVWTLDQQLKVGLRYFDVNAGFKLPTDKDVIIRDGGRLNNIEDKVKNMRSHFCNNHIVLTDSAASTMESPKSLAQTINKKFNNFVEQYKRDQVNKGCLGVLSLNFPSTEIVKNIIQLNPITNISTRGTDF